MMMDTTRKRKPPWQLLVKKDGKDVEAGRFETDALAQRFAEDYGLVDWRVKGPKATISE